MTIRFLSPVAKAAIRQIAALSFAGILLCGFPGYAADQDSGDNDPWAKLTPRHPFSISGGILGPSTDTRPIFIYWTGEGEPGIGSLKIAVPRNNIIMLQRDRRDRIYFISAMLFPDFSGATVDTINEFNFRGWEKSPHIVTLSGPFSDLGHSNKNMLSWEDFNEKHETVYGLMKANHSKLGPQTNVYYGNDPQLGRVVISCNSPDNNDHYIPECDVNTNITDNIIIVYRYHRDLLPQWRNIHEHVLDFINSSIKKG